MTKAKPTKRQTSQNSTPFEKQSEKYSTTGGNEDFQSYWKKLYVGSDCKHLMLVGGTEKENNEYVEDMKGLRFKPPIYVDCSNRNVEQLRKEIYNSMYTYDSKTDSFKNIGRASTADILNKSRDDKRRANFKFRTGKPGKITLGNYRLCILNNVSSVNNGLWCELAVVIDREEYRQYILIVTVPSKEELGKLPKPWRDLFEVVSLGGEETIVKPSETTTGSEVERQEEKVEKIPPKGKYVFHKRDDIYIIQYEHESFMLQATDGLKYIHYLLNRPYNAKNPREADNKFIPSKLYTETHKLPPMADEDAIATVGEALMKAGAHGVRSGYTFKGGSRGDYTEDVVNPETKQKIKELENKRDIAKSTGNKEKADRVQTDIDELKKEYVKCLMAGGKSLKFPSSFHKPPYDNISKAMNVVYEKIKKHSEENGYSSMLTWKHLSNSIKFRYSCFFYEPENLPKWQF